MTSIELERAGLSFAGGWVLERLPAAEEVTWRLGELRLVLFVCDPEPGKLAWEERGRGRRHLCIPGPTECGVRRGCALATRGAGGTVCWQGDESWEVLHRLQLGRLTLRVLPFLPRVGHKTYLVIKSIEQRDPGPSPQEDLDLDP